MSSVTFPLFILSPNHSHQQNEKKKKYKCTQQEHFSEQKLQVGSKYKDVILIPSGSRVIPIGLLHQK